MTQEHVTQTTSQDPADLSTYLEAGAAAPSRRRTRTTQSPRPVPRMGWPAFWYGVKRLFKSSAAPPALSRKERDLLSQAYDEALAEEVARQEARRQCEVRAGSLKNLTDLANQVPSLTFGFWNTKGAGATTTTAVNTMAMFAEEIRGITTLIIDGNPAAGTCAARYGLNYGDTITTQELARDIRDDEDLRHRDFKSVINEARPSKHGVRVVSADSIMDEHRRLTGKSTSRVLELMGYNSEYMGVDTPNDVGEVVARAIAGYVDVFVFTANIGVPDSLRKLSTTMETLRRLGFEDKVNHSVVVISNLPKGGDLGYYRKFLNEVNYEDEVTRNLEQLFDGQFVGVTHDGYVALDRIVDLDKLGWETYQDYINVATSILCQSPKLRGSSQVSTFAPNHPSINGGVRLSDERSET